MSVAQAAYGQANTEPTGTAAYKTANAAYNVANSAWFTANTANATANIALSIAQSGYNAANNALSNTGNIITVNSQSILFVSNTTPSNAINNGALVVSGGVGIAGNAYHGGLVSANNGLYSSNNFTGSYTDGIVVDYVTGNGRISVGTADGITFYNGGVANNQLLAISSNGVMFAGQIYSSNTITANTFTGSGAGLTGTASNLTANVATYVTISNTTNGIYYPQLTNNVSGNNQTYANSAYVFDVANSYFGVGNAPQAALDVTGAIRSNGLSVISITTNTGANATVYAGAVIQNQVSANITGAVGVGGFYGSSNAVTGLYVAPQVITSYQINGPSKLVGIYVAPHYANTTGQGAASTLYGGYFDASKNDALDSGGNFNVNAAQYGVYNNVTTGRNRTNTGPLYGTYNNIAASGNNASGVTTGTLYGTYNSISRTTANTGVTGNVYSTYSTTSINANNDVLGVFGTSNFITIKANSVQSIVGYDTKISVQPYDTNSNNVISNIYEIYSEGTTISGTGTTYAIANNRYGLYLGPLSGNNSIYVANNYGIYSSDSAANNYFAGSIYCVNTITSNAFSGNVYATSVNANKIYVNGTSSDIYDLDDISYATDGRKNTFALKYNQTTVSANSPFNLMVTINGLVQPAFDYKYDTFWLANVLTASKGYCLDNSGNIKFADSPPQGSQILIRTVFGSVPANKKVYPFKPLDILMGY